MSSSIKTRRRVCFAAAVSILVVFAVSVMWDERNVFQKDASLSRSRIPNIATIRKARQEIKQLRKELQNSYSNYLIHIPKTGGNSLIRMLNSDRKELSVIKPSTVCNHKYEPVENADNWTHCWLHTTESHFSTKFSRRFTVVRNPYHHVVSQFYHCKEANGHEQKDLMPDTLDEWLEAWNTDGNNKFHCYNPRNLQSRRMGFMERNLTDLSVLFDVIGLTTEMRKTACLISISIHDEIPKHCDCSSNSTTTQRNYRLSHGVKHHGDTVNLTDHQRLLIANLTAKDARLYEAAEMEFWQKVQQVEAENSIKLC